MPGMRVNKRLIERNSSSEFKLNIYASRLKVHTVITVRRVCSTLTDIGHKYMCCTRCENKAMNIATLRADVLAGPLVGHDSAGVRGLVQYESVYIK